MQNTSSYSSLDTLLPWSSSAKEDKRFNILVIIFLLFLLFASFWVKSVQLPKVDRKELEALPPSIAKIIIKKKEELKRKPVEIKKVTEEVAQKTEEAPKVEEVKQVEVEKPAEVKQAIKPVMTAEQVREIKVSEAKAVANKEISKIKDDLASMRNMFAPKSIAPGGGGNGGIKVSTALGNSGAGVSRSQIVGAGTGGSGGISVSSGASSGLGGGSGGGSGTGIGSGSGRGDTNVDSVTLGGAIVDTGGDVADAIKSAGSAGNRSEESIRSTLDANKSALYAIYNRALREDPSLQGKVVFKLVIEPDGSVSSCSIVSTELNDPALGNKLISRMKFINFGPDDVTQTTTQWAIDFLPN